MCRRRNGEREFVARQRPCDVTGCLDLSTRRQSSQTTGASGGQLTSLVGCPHIRFGRLTDSGQMTWASDVTRLFAERAAMRAACALSLQSSKYVTCALFYAKAFSTLFISSCSVTAKHNKRIYITPHQSFEISFND